MCSDTSAVFSIYVLVCVCVCGVWSVYLPENEDLVPTSYIQTVDAPPNVDVREFGRLVLDGC